MFFGSVAVISAFVNRQPWLAGVIALVLGPVVGMLYIGRGRWALSYVGGFFAMVAIPHLAGHLGLMPVDAESVRFVLWVAYRLGGAVHCARLAPSLEAGRPEAWFARWYVVVTIGIFLPVAVPFFLWEPHYLPAKSMLPGIQPGDHFFVSKYPYLFAEPERGDLVVFLLPRDNEMAYVKRLIGLPGDRIQMKAGELYLNGERVSRSVVESSSLLHAPEDGQTYIETLAGGRSYMIHELFLDVGPYDDTEVYEVPPGHYFFLGDSRDNSMDSRRLDHVGFIPAENIIGRVGLVYWNSERQKLVFQQAR